VPRRRSEGALRETLTDDDGEVAGVDSQNFKGKKGWKK